MSDDNENFYAPEGGDDAASAVKKAMEEIGFGQEEDDEDEGNLSSPMDEEPKSDVVRADDFSPDEKREDSPVAEGKKEEESPEEEPKGEPAPKAEGEPDGEDADKTPDYLKGLPDEDVAAIQATGDRAESIAQRVRFADEMQRAGEPFIAEYAKIGLKPEEAFIGLSRINAFANEKPAEYLRWFAERVRMTPEQVAEAVGFKSKQDTFDPFADDEDQDEQPQQPQVNFDPQAASTQEAVAMLDKWMTATGEDGKPLRPHIDKVGTVMGGMIAQARNAGVAITPDLLDKAYEEAMWATPDLRQELLAEREAQAGAKAKAEAESARAQGAKQSGEKARRASRTLKAGSQGGRSKTSAPDPNANLEAFLKQQMQSMDL